MRNIVTFFLILAYLISIFPEKGWAGEGDLLPPPMAPSTVTDKPSDEEIAKRRKYLQIHQGFGIATVALLGATTALGQLNYDDVINGKGTQKYQTAHRSLVIASSTAFAAAGIAALLAPTPFKKRPGFDTATVHKWSMALATAAMAAQIVLGIKAHSGRGTLDEQKYAEAHLALGYATLGLTTIGAGVLFF